MMFIKNRPNGTPNWAVYHVSIGATKYLSLNLTNGEATSVTAFNSTTPTSSVFSVGTAVPITNNASQGYVAYCFAPVAGYSAFGSYTGNGSSDGTFVYTGFRPRFIMWKRTDSTASWNILDTARDTRNISGNALFPNLSNAEFAGSVMDILSNGFKLRDTADNHNANGGTYIYAAFAESPFKYSVAR
jgi:hypothetical protein